MARSATPSPLGRLRAVLGLAAPGRTVPTPGTSCVNCGLPSLEAPLSRFCSDECRTEHPLRPAADVGATRDTVVSAGTRPRLVDRDAAGGRDAQRPSPRPRSASRTGASR